MPDCKEWIYLSKPFKKDYKILMNKSQNEEVKRLWEKHHENEKYAGLSSAQWVSKTSHEITKAIEIGDIQTAKNLSLEISIKAKDKEQRKIFKAQSIKFELLSYKEIDHPDLCGVTINKCSPIDGTEESRTITIEQAIKEMPIPCDNEYCKCWYSLSFDNNEKEISTKTTAHETLEATLSSEPKKKKGWLKRLFG